MEQNKTEQSAQKPARQTVRQRLEQSNKKWVMLLFHAYRRVERSLVPVLMVLLVPLLFGLLVGYEFSGQMVDQVPTCIVDQDNSQLSRDLAEKIRTNDTFHVTNYAGSPAELQDLIEHNQVATGIIIPSGFSQDLTTGKAPKVMVWYDGTQMSMAGSAKGKVAETLNTIKSGYLMQVMMGNFNLSQEQAIKYAQPIQYTTRVLGNPGKSNQVFMLQGLTLNFVQVAVFMLGAELVRKNERNYKNLLKHGLFAGFIGFISTLLCVCSHILAFGFPFRGSIAAAAVMTVIYLTAIANLGIAMMLVQDDRLEVAKSSSIIMLMFMLCGYTFPVLGMPHFLQIVSKFVPFSYYVQPMRDLALLGSSFEMMLPYIGCLLVFLVITLVVLAAAMQMARRRRKPFAEKLEARISYGE